MAAKKRRVKGPTEQRKITLPGWMWELLEETASLHTDAYKLNGGATSYSVSDGIETAVGMLLISLREDLGPLPTKDSTKAERDAWVKKLAAQISREILEEFWSKKSH